MRLIPPSFIRLEQPGALHLHAHEADAMFWVDLAPFKLFGGCRQPPVVVGADPLRAYETKQTNLLVKLNLNT